jgi:CheY-like chemotaxis protein
VAQILLVEDDPVMAEGIRDVLELGGHAVSIASDGVEGLMALAQTPRDLIISDVKMPRMDGFKFYQAVRANPTWVFIPFIFLTARDQHEGGEISIGGQAEDATGFCFTLPAVALSAA